MTNYVHVYDKAVHQTMKILIYPLPLEYLVKLKIVIMAMVKKGHKMFQFNFQNYVNNFITLSILYTHFQL